MNSHWLAIKRLSITIGEDAEKWQLSTRWRGHIKLTNVAIIGKDLYTYNTAI